MADDLILKVTPADVENKAAEIDKSRGTMETILTEMKTQVDSLQESWASDSGAAYVERYAIVRQEIEDSLQNLEKHVTHLKTAAQKYTDSETEGKNAVTGLDAANIF